MIGDNVEDGKKIENFYKHFGSGSFRLQSEMAEDWGKKSMDLYFKSIDFIYKIVSTIGVIAGFGFIGLGYVGSIYNFIFGEALLFSAMIIGVWSVPKIYFDEKSDLDKLYSKIRTHFHGYNDLFDSIFHKAQEVGFSRDELNKLINKDKELLKILKDETDNKKKPPHVIFIIHLIIAFFVCGTLSILLSFIK